jgi:lysophospholipase L1-like esterase
MLSATTPLPLVSALAMAALAAQGCTGSVDRVDPVPTAPSAPTADAAGAPASEADAAAQDAAAAPPADDSGSALEDAGLHAGDAAVADAGADAGASSAPLVSRGLRVIGRATLDDPDVTAFAWSGAGLALRFRGTGVSVDLESDVDGLMHDVRVDGLGGDPIASQTTRRSYTLASGLEQGEHSVVLTRETEGQRGTSRLGAVRVSDGELLEPGPQPLPRIEIVGDSITAGYGILGADQTCSYSYATQRFSLTYGALTAAALGGEAVGIAISGHGLFRNLDGSSTLLLPEAYERTLTNSTQPAWVSQQHPEVIVVNLGTNDYGAPGEDPSLPYRDAYLEFVGRLRSIHPDALIVAALGSMVSDEGKPSLTRWRDSIAAVLAAREAAGDARMISVEFPLDTMSDLGCDWHPNAAKHAAMASQLTRALRSAGI